MVLWFVAIYVVAMCLLYCIYRYVTCTYILISFQVHLCVCLEKIVNRETILTPQQIMIPKLQARKNSWSYPLRSYFNDMSGAKKKQLTRCSGSRSVTPLFMWSMRDGFRGFLLGIAASPGCRPLGTHWSSIALEGPSGWKKSYWTKDSPRKSRKTMKK